MIREAVYLQIKARSGEKKFPLYFSSQCLFSQKKGILTLLRQTVLLHLEQVPEGKKANIKFNFLTGRGETGITDQLS